MRPLPKQQQIPSFFRKHTRARRIAKQPTEVYKDVVVTFTPYDMKFLSAVEQDRKIAKAVKDSNPYNSWAWFPVGNGTEIKHPDGSRTWTLKIKYYKKPVG